MMVARSGCAGPRWSVGVTGVVGVAACVGVDTDDGWRGLGMAAFGADPPQPAIVASRTTATDHRARRSADPVRGAIQAGYP